MFNRKPSRVLTSDTHGPYPISIDGKKFWTSLACKDTGRIFIATTFLKSETAGEIQFRLQSLANSAGDCVELRHDSTRDYCKVSNYLRTKGIEEVKTGPYSSAENGHAERNGRTINTKARCLLIASGIPIQFWTYAVEHAAWLFNRTPRLRDGKWTCPIAEFEDNGNYFIELKDNLPVFGQLGYVFIPKEKRQSSFSPVSNECVLLGFYHSHELVYDFATGSVKEGRSNL